MDNGFRQIGKHLFKCITCGKELGSGIVSLSSHWAECTGKEFHESILKSFKDGTLDIDKLEQLKDEHK